MIDASSISANIQNQYEQDNSFGDFSVGDMAREDANSLLTRMVTDPTKSVLSSLW